MSDSITRLWVECFGGGNSNDGVVPVTAVSLFSPYQIFIDFPGCVTFPNLDISSLIVFPPSLAVIPLISYNELIYCSKMESALYPLGCQICI